VIVSDNVESLATLDNNLFKNIEQPFLPV
jgi:hypothetical protein